jgi:hypothetical protein
LNGVLQIIINIHNLPKPECNPSNGPPQYEEEEENESKGCENPDVNKDVNLCRGGHVDVTNTSTLPMVALLAFFQGLRDSDLIDPATMHAFVEAAILVTLESGIGIWLPWLPNIHPSSKVLRTLLKFTPGAQYFQEFCTYLIGFYNAFPLEINVSSLVLALMRLTHNFEPEICNGMISIFVSFLSVLFRNALRVVDERLDDSYSRQLQLTFKSIYTGIRQLCQPNEMMQFVELAIVRFRQLFRTLNHAMGAFQPGWKSWKNFIKFHRLLYYNTGVDIEFQGKVTSDYAAIPELYSRCIHCDENEKTQMNREFEELLIQFEFSRHNKKSIDDCEFK